MVLTTIEVIHAIKKMVINYQTSMVLVVSLAFGVATNATVFGWIDAFVLNPLPSVADNQSLYSVTSVAGDDDYIDSSFKDYVDIRNSGGTFSQAFAFKSKTVSAWLQGSIKPVKSAFVSQNYFDALGVKPHLGRFFHPSDNAEVIGGANVIVVSYDFWLDQLQGNDDVIGQSLTLKDQVYSIIGIAPEGFWGEQPYDRRQIWLPVSQMGVFFGSNKWFEERQTRPFKIMTRLGAQDNQQQAQSQLNMVMDRLSQTYPDTNRSIDGKVYPFIDSPEGGASQMTQLIVVLYLTSLVILAIICANLVNVSFVQAVAREKEFSIKQSIGAKSTRIALSLLLEGAIISLFAALISVLCVYGLYDLLASQNMATPMFVVTNNSLPPAIIGYCFAVTLITGLLISIAPIMRLRGINLATTLQDSMRGSTTGKGARWVRNSLIVFQITLAFIAIVFAGSFVISGKKVQEIDPGFNPQNIMLVNLAPVNAIPTRGEYASYIQGVTGNLQAMSEVSQVAFAEFVPLGGNGGSWETIDIEGYTFAPDENAKLYRNFVSDNYFSVMDIALVQGRTFDGNDTVDGAPVAIVNQAFVDKYFPQKSVLGRKIRGWGRDIVIVGVVADSKVNRRTETVKPYFYLPFQQFASTGAGVTLHVKHQAGSLLSLSTLQSSIKGQGDVMYIAWSMPLVEYVKGSSYIGNVATIALTLLSGIALFLSAIGIYGVINRSVVQRTQEIGIRMAIGATSMQIVLMILRQLMYLVLIGCVLGYAFVMAINEDLAALLYDHNQYDLGLLVVTLGVILGVAMLASLMPSIYASRIQPAKALAVN